MRPMAECELPYNCPECGMSAPRVILTAPHCSTLSAASRSVHAVNERSTHAAQSLSEYKPRMGRAAVAVLAGHRAWLPAGRAEPRGF